MRVYLPATLPLVARLLSQGALSAPVPGFAVTQVLRAWADANGPSDDEELELVALSEAARASLRLLAGGPGDSPVPSRVVLACDVPDALVRVDDGSDLAWPGQVAVTGDVLLAWVKAAHVDDAAAGPAVRSAAAAVDAADAADADGSAGEALVAALDAHELLWYAADELPSLIG